jgi:hypothetical protein
MKHKFNEGCMWEGDDFYIYTDHECSEYGDGKMCRHCHSKETKVELVPNGTIHREVVWICPRVVVAYNEAGLCSTGVCLDCIIEAAQSLGD